MYKKVNTFKINFILGITVVIFSFITIYWHEQMRVLFKLEEKVNEEGEGIIALNKQLLVDLSEAKSGISIKNKAIEELNMHAPVDNFDNEYLGETRSIALPHHRTRY